MESKIGMAIADINQNGKMFSQIDNANVIVSPSHIVKEASKRSNIDHIVYDQVVRSIKMSAMINGSLNRGCDEISCCLKDQCIFRCSPVGNPSASIMIVKAMPTDIEMYSRTVFTDPNGILIRQMLYEAGADMNDLYFSTIMKCANLTGQINSQSVLECINHYIRKEICDIVKPKAIFFCGSGSISACIKYNLLPKGVKSEDINGGHLFVDYLDSEGRKVTVRTFLISDMMRGEDVHAEANRIRPVIQRIKEVNNGQQ